MGESKKVNVALWVVQVVLALVFLLSGGMKLVMPIEMMKGPVALPGALLRFVGVAEVMGALGLVLPGLFRLHERLTPLAASGLIVIMAGAVVITVVGGSAATALVPLMFGLLALSVAYGRAAYLKF